MAKRNVNKNNPDPSSPPSAPTSISADRIGASDQPNPTTRPMRQAAFLGAVAGDCGCPRCSGYRDIAHMVMNPGSEY
jgi:hypothetical protein